MVFLTREHPPIVLVLLVPSKLIDYNGSCTSRRTRAVFVRDKFKSVKIYSKKLRSRFVRDTLLIDKWNIFFNVSSIIYFFVQIHSDKYSDFRFKQTLDGLHYYRKLEQDTLFTV